MSPALRIDLQAECHRNAMNALRVLHELGKQNLARNVSGLHCVRTRHYVGVLRVDIAER
jgi:hypothetical protein